MSHSTAQRPRAALLLAITATLLGGCASGATAPPTDPPPSATAAPEAVAGGTITLTDDGCTWANNPSSVSGRETTLEIRNETDDYGAFFVHRMKPEFTWQDGEAAIAAIQDAIAADEDWPNWASNVSVVVSEGDAAAGGVDVVGVPAANGTYGVVCSANTNSQGDVLTVFLAGPLEVSGT
ncbi:MAG TPA: hypothetical protein VFC71_06995 [Candidatus Polarisedimenticolia bacterium]|nr:hypothetical protein [Candidatus Polarisedimenticolia bacterium]